jgi:hypothetical protein
VITVDKPNKAEVAWNDAVKTLHGATRRTEITLAEVPAPNRLAPYALALSGVLALDSDNELASGKFVLLHDPDGQPTWESTFRVVTFVNAEIEPDVVTDEMFDEVAWSWLIEALGHSYAEFTNLSGTVTRTVSRSFAGLADRQRETELEIRASWSPSSSELAAHLTAWCSLLEQASGLEPLPEGVTQINRNK